MWRSPALRKPYTAIKVSFVIGLFPRVFALCHVLLLRTPSIRREIQLFSILPCVQSTSGLSKVVWSWPWKALFMGYVRAFRSAVCRRPQCFMAGIYVTLWTKLAIHHSDLFERKRNMTLNCGAVFLAFFSLELSLFKLSFHFKYYVVLTRYDKL